MWIETHHLDTTASAAAIFALWRDTGHWQDWNEGVQRIDLDGPFATGTAGTMVMPDGERLAFTLSWVQQGSGFEDETAIPGAGATVRVRHVAETAGPGRTRITYTASIDGPAAGEIGPSLGPQITGDFPQVLKSLAALAESGARPR